MKKAATSRLYPGPGPALTEVKGLLRRFKLRARKGLGQHFLVDNEVLAIICRAARLAPDDVVIEVGPGLGVLTRELAGRAGRVIAVELDSRLADVLRQVMAPAANVTVINQDILKITPVELVFPLTAVSPAMAEPFNYKVVANLPYYITAPVLRHFLEATVKPRLMVVMVQKEVAQAITAAPGKMSLLSVSVQFYGEPEVVDYVPASSFYPVPEVDSAVLRISPHPEPVVGVADVPCFFKLVRAGFSAARKQLGNSLSQGMGLSRAEVLPWLEMAGIAPRRRAETLSLDEWSRLWGVYRREGGTAC